MPKRTLSKSLTHHQTRDLIDAAHHATTIRKPLNTFVAINPRCLDVKPNSIADWVGSVLNKIRIYMKRLPPVRGSKSKRMVGYYLIWARENYQGTDREHLHLVMHCPAIEMTRFEERLRSWYPGEPGAIYVDKAMVGTNWTTGRRQNFSLTYVLKQCTPQAWWASGMQIMRENACRNSGAKVAPVLGKRCGVSETIGWKVREAYRLRPGAAEIAATEALEAVSTPGVVASCTSAAAAAIEVGQAHPRSGTRSPTTSGRAHAPIHHRVRRTTSSPARRKDRWTSGTAGRRRTAA